MALELLSTSMQVLSSVSAAASLTIVVAYHKFPKLQKKSYFSLQYYIAVSLILTNVGSALGIAETGTIACWIQGILTNIFTLSSLQWTTVVTYSLYSIVHSKRQVSITPAIHFYCWGIPTLVTFLPLINSTYGTNGNWCWVIPTKHTPNWAADFWFWFSFYAWVWVGFIGMIIVLSILTPQLRHRKVDTTDRALATLQNVIRKLYWFPFIILVSWIIPCISDTILHITGYYNLNFGSIGSLLACSQGLLTSVVLWTQDEELRSIVFPRLINEVAPLGHIHHQSNNAIVEDGEVITSPPVVTMRYSVHNDDASNVHNHNNINSDGTCNYDAANDAIKTTIRRSGPLYRNRAIDSLCESENNKEKVDGGLSSSLAGGGGGNNSEECVKHYSGVFV
jgi:hypothetical protein